MPGLTHHEARALFQPWVDQELATPEAHDLEAHLADCADCRSGWQDYANVVRELRSLPAPPLPPQLASQILRRARRRRPFLRMLQLTSAYRVPVELILPLLVATALAWWFMAAQ